MAGIGNHLDHIVHDVINGTPRVEVWVGLRNAYFRDGSNAEAWARMCSWFAERGVRTTRGTLPSATRELLDTAVFTRLAD